MALQQNTITLTGRLGADPQPFGPSQPPTMCSFRLAVSRGYYDDTRQWRTLPTTWVTVKAYRALAHNVLTCLRKGTPVIVAGTLGMDEWSDANGKRQTSLFVNAGTIGHDLNYGTTYLSQPRRDQPAVNGQPADGAGGGNAVGGAAAAGPNFGANGAGPHAGPNGGAAGGVGGYADPFAQTPQSVFAPGRPSQGDSSVAPVTIDVPDDAADPFAVAAAGAAEADTVMSSVTPSAASAASPAAAVSPVASGTPSGSAASTMSVAPSDDVPPPDAPPADFDDPAF